MKTRYSRLLLAFLLLILIVPQVGAEDPPKDGPYVEYYENGQKKSEFYYKNGQRVGLWSGWYENEKRKWEIHYENGEIHGLWAKWHENGQKKLEAQYKNGKLDGVWTRWDTNGLKFKEVHYKNGERVGVWTRWDENGQKGQEGNRKDDEPDERESRLDENGQKGQGGNRKDDEPDGANKSALFAIPLLIVSYISGVVGVIWNVIIAFQNRDYLWGISGFFCGIILVVYAAQNFKECKVPLSLMALAIAGKFMATALALQSS